MTRGPTDRGDTVVVSTVAGASHKSYPLAQIPNNYSYEDVSDQPEAQPNQPLACPLSFHGGMAYSHYDPSTAGYVENLGWITNEPNVLRPPLKINTVTLTGAANPVQYAFETTVNDSGGDDGDPVAYFIAPEAAEINVYKVSLSATGANGSANAAVTTTAGSPGTLTDTRAAWTVNGWAGRVVTCNSQTLTVASNTATVLTGGDWSGDPGDGAAWVLGLGGYGYVANIKTFSLTPTQPMGRPTEWNDGTNTEWRVPTGDTTNDIQSLASCVSGIAADTWGSGDADARHLQLFGNKLARSTGSNEICLLAKGANPETEASWGDEFYVGEVGTKITELGESGGLLYIAKEDGFYEWDGEGEAVNILPETGQKSRNGQGMVYWHGGFLIPTASGLWWTRTGKPVGPDSNPDNRGNHPSIGGGRYFKQGRWMGLAPFGEYIYGLYVNSTQSAAYLTWGRERDPSDPPGWGPIIWHTIDVPAADLADFHGIFALETSGLGTATVYPSLWFTDGNDVSYLILDHDGAPRQRRGSIELEDSGSAIHITSGDLDFGLPGIQKQLRVIEGWAEDTTTGHSFRFRVGIDGGSYADVGAAITSTGFFQRFWVQDTADTGRSMQVGVLWTGTSNLTKQDGPHLRDVVVRVLAQPNTTRVWTFLLTARDAAGKTGKLVRSELEAYKNDLKKYELPDGDSFNGVLAKVRLLRADEVMNLTPHNQQPPHYVMEATVREMIAA